MDFAEAANLRTYLSRLLPEGMKTVATRDMFAMRSWIESTVIQMITVIAFIHSRGILHLDIKPGNVYLRNDGSPLLIDFGAARQTLSAGGAMLAWCVLFVLRPRLALALPAGARQAWRRLRART